MRRTHVAVYGDSVILEHVRRAGGTRACQIHVVFDCQRHAGERRQGLAGRACGVDSSGRLEGELGSHLQKGLDIGLTRFDCGRGRRERLPLP